MFLSYLRIHPSIKQHAQIFEPVLLWKHHTIVRERILQRRDRLTIKLNHLRLGRVHSQSFLLSVGEKERQQRLMRIWRVVSHAIRPAPSPLEASRFNSKLANQIP